MTTYVDRVTARAEQVDTRRLLLVALMVLPFALGWTARTVVRVLGAAVSWLWAAALVGWDAAGSAGPEPESVPHAPEGPLVSGWQR